MLQVFHAVFSLRRTVVHGQVLPHRFLVQRGQAVQFLLKGRLVADGGHIRVMAGVIAHDVALRRHPADDVRRGFNHISHHKERGGGVVLFQSIQDGFGVPIFITAVEGEVDDLFGRVAQVVGVVPGQFLRRGIAHRGLSLVGEGQSPVGGGSRDSGGRGHGLGRCGDPPLDVQRARQKQAGEKQ